MWMRDTLRWKFAPGLSLSQSLGATLWFRNTQDEASYCCSKRWRCVICPAKGRNQGGDFPWTIIYMKRRLMELLLLQLRTVVMIYFVNSYGYSWPQSPSRKRWSMRLDMLASLKEHNRPLPWAWAGTSSRVKFLVIMPNLLLHMKKVLVSHNF